jgi:hypothetical protein
MKHATNLFLLLLLLVLMSHNKSSHYTNIIENSSQLANFINFNQKTYDHDSIIIIYTYLGCKPCQALAQRVQLKFNQPKYWQRIVFVNDIDIVFDTSKVRQYLNTKKLPFPYLLAKNEKFGGTYPLICYYGQKGSFIRSSEGMGLGTIKGMADFLNK